MQATNNLTLLDGIPFSSVEERFMRAFMQAVRDGQRVVVKPSTFYVEVNESLWLGITTYRNLEVLKDPGSFPHKRIDIESGSELDVACKAFVQKANQAAVADILSDMGF